MRTAAAVQSNPVELAYLEDRTAVDHGRLQIYGTQVTCIDGELGPRLSTPSVWTSSAFVGKAGSAVPPVARPGEDQPAASWDDAPWLHQPQPPPAVQLHARPPGNASSRARSIWTWRR